MKTPAKCPGCGTKLEPDAEICPNCPLSFTGDSDGEPNPLKHEASYYPLIMPAVFFGCLGLVVWKIGTGLMYIASDPSQHERGSFETGGGPVTKEAVAKTMADSIRQVDADGLGQNGASDRDAASAEGESHEAVTVVKETADARTPAVSEWRLRGTVYDLITLKPVAGAKLTLTDNETNARAETTTDAAGRYKTVLPPLHRHGYLVAIAKSGYASSYAGPESAGVADLDAGSRKELARQLARSVEAPTSLEPGGGAPYVTNFFLAPLDPK